MGSEAQQRRTWWQRRGKDEANHDDDDGGADGPQPVCSVRGEGPGEARLGERAPYTEDVVFADPETSSVGRAALEARARAILDAAPGFEFAHDGPLYVGGDLAVLAWSFGPPGAPVARGVDVAFFRQGKICKLHTIFSSP